jgi:hypothetical protein
MGSMRWTAKPMSLLAKRIHAIGRADVANAAFAAATKNLHDMHRMHRYERHPDTHIPPDTIRA